MNPIIKNIREEIENTDNVVAHTNCFHSWDGNVDLGVIKQGLLERLSAFEKFHGKQLGVAVTRKNLNETVIEIGDLETQTAIDSITLYFLISSSVGLDDYLTIEERRTLINTLAAIKH